jgi:hypothetical protein
MELSTLTALVGGAICAEEMIEPQQKAEMLSHLRPFMIWGLFVGLKR